MIFIALGCNLGDRSAMLVRAHTALMAQGIMIQKQSTIIEVAALLPPNAPPEWNMPFLNQVIEVTTALPPVELLSALKAIERTLGREDRGHWAPREIDLDIIAYHALHIQSETLTVPHARLHTREFVLTPLHEIAPEWEHPLYKRTAGELLAILKKPKLFGILNVTPDSFSGDGTHANQAIARLNALREEGADYIDIGAESTRPNAAPVLAEEEWARLAPVIEHTAPMYGDIISVDTRHAATAQKALALGVRTINDVSGLRDTAMLAVLKRHDCRIIVMHALSIPADTALILPADADPIAVILQWKQQVLSLGIAPERFLFDPGIGFGKTAQQSLMLIERTHELVASGGSWLYGHSRKSFMKIFTDAAPNDRDRLTVKFSSDLAAVGVDAMRVHNVALHRQRWCL